MFNFVYFIFVYVFVLLYFFGKVLVIWGGSEKWTRTIENLMSRIYPFFSWSKYPHFGLKDLRWDRFVSESTTLGWVMRLNRTVGVTKLVVEWRRPWTLFKNIYLIKRKHLLLGLLSWLLSLCRAFLNVLFGRNGGIHYRVSLDSLQ